MTSSATALVDLLAAAEGGEDSGFQSPTIAEFYPEPLVSFTVLGIDFEITRITVIMIIARVPTQRMRVIRVISNSMPSTEKLAITSG